MAEVTISSAGEVSSEPWFTRGDVDLLLYRVNRRPITADPSLFEPEANLMSHLERVLSRSQPGQSGTKNRRDWRLGNLRFGGASFTGQLGWERSGATLGQSWDDNTHSWIERVVAKDDSAVAPMAFDSRGRILGVLRHPSFSTSENALPDVLSQILNRGENQEDVPTTRWAVEPLGDTADFYGWLESLDQLNILRMIFNRPNPDGEEAFQELFERLDALRAEQIKEEIRARDQDSGLARDAIQTDRTTQGFLIAALDHAFGRIWAKGRRGGKQVTYDQRANVARQAISDVGDDWETATTTVLAAVADRSNRQVTDGQDAQPSGLLDQRPPLEDS